MINRILDRKVSTYNPAGIAKVHQVAHGFAVGVLVWPGPTFAAPGALSRNFNGGTPGVVYQVDGPDDFRVCFSGKIRIPGASYAPFQVYYLYNGALSPSAYNMPFAVPVALAVSSDELVMGLARQQRDQIFTNIKTAHGFIVGTVLYWDTIGGTWIKADAAQGHDGIGVVVNVVDANTYQMQFDGCCYLPALASSPAIDFHFGGGVNAGVLYEGPGGGGGFAASGYASRSVLYHMGSGSCYLYGYTMRASHSHFLGILHDVGLSTLHDRDALSWSTSTGKWLNLPGLPNATADKQFPRWNLSLGKWEAVLLGVSTMDDVVLSGIQDRDILEWDTTTSKWVNVRGLDQGTAVKQVLVWNTITSKWEHSGIQVPFLDDTNIGTLHDRDVLAWSTATTKWVNLPGLPAATVNGQVPVWNASLSRWDAGTAAPDLGDMAYYPDPLTIGAGETGDNLGVMSPGQFVLSNSAPIAFTGDDISTATGAMTFQAYLDQATDDLSARWYVSGATADPEMKFTYATGEFRFRKEVLVGKDPSLATSYVGKFRTVVSTDGDWWELWSSGFRHFRRSYSTTNPVFKIDDGKITAGYGELTATSRQGKITVLNSTDGDDVELGNGNGIRLYDRSVSTTNPALRLENAKAVVGYGEAAVSSQGGDLIAVMGTDGDYLRVNGSKLQIFKRSVSTSVPMIEIDLAFVPTGGWTTAKKVKLTEQDECDSSGAAKKRTYFCSDQY